MLNKPVQDAIRHCYQNLQAQLDNFIPRRAQNYLVAEIAKTLGGSYDKKRRILVAEAGTGIGKSLSYLIGAIPLAMASNRKVVISTATVALQEQLLHKDLPLLQRIYEKEVTVQLAKGRQRYCCSEKLIAFAEPDNSHQIALWEQKPKRADVELVKRLFSALKNQKWDGDRDSWPTHIPDQLWQHIMADKHSCHAGLPLHRHCPFAKARDGLETADVIIANHALLMADVELGGGVILPEPESTFYLIDEAHHLPQVARDFSAGAASLMGAASWLENLNQQASKIANVADIKQSGRFLNQLQDQCQFLIPELRDIAKQVDPAVFADDETYRFEHGELPEWLSLSAKAMAESSKKALQSLGKIHDLISERIKTNEIAPRLADPALAESGFFLQRLENLEKVWGLMAQPNKDKGAPLARWLSRNKEKDNDYIVEVSPLEVGYRLDSMLWSRACGAVLTSATLRALNQFTFFCRQVGLAENDGSQYLALSSPFNYTEQGRLVIPNMRYLPQDQGFTQELEEKVLEYLEGETASLVLFASYWQMNQVAQAIEKTCIQRGWLLLVQGSESRQSLLEKHRNAIAKGKTSILFGTGSFSEGLDLPGKLLENVIVTKIPFAVPTSPIEAAHAEYIESKGGNPFLQITVPEASKKLIQSVGRLLRKEHDSGRVVILDRRIITKRYGKALLDALPPFTRVIEK
ncbi:ATP-dependent DNA helicase DinG [Thaumasiovibrio subtropicus]|uniref:ATP-dependent DNA helicase DinG n=1 Tax=Thaumasiovibrio subtropicus TaxID=1891207 RepID=UPI000B35746B|nr:ATP-dependent DNA helicase DinG [Thaumasiovibrio subtropicus]